MVRVRVGMAVVLAAMVLAAVALPTGRTGPVAAPAQGLDAPVVRTGPDRPSTGVRPVLSRSPNIVLVLMDDFSLDLLPTMRHAARMRREGADFSHAFVVDSLCCVSRASLATGQYPHQTGVLTNTANTPNPHGPIGGWEAFTTYGNEARSVNVRLQDAGYRTGFVGKYLNQYEIRDGVLPAPPQGWDQWGVVFGSAYDGWGFQHTWVEDDQLELRAVDVPWSGASDVEKDAAYAGTVVEELALEFLREQSGSGAPYFLQVAPYAPHSRVGPYGAWPGEPVFPPAFRDRPGPGRPLGDCGAVRCDRLTVADLPGFGDDQADNRPVYADGSPAPDWKAGLPGLTAPAAEESLRNRARMVQSIDRMLGRILDAVDENTYVVLTSDNGFHLGQHGLARGKGAPYESDVHVPLLVVGPGVAPGERRGLVNNIDLAPTFEELAGLQPADFRAGSSLVEALATPAAEGAGAVFIEHTWAPSLGTDPDRSYSGGTIDAIPSYVAVRSRHALLVRLDVDPSWTGTEHAWEYYDYRDAGFERTNTFAAPTRPRELRRLQGLLAEFDACSGLTGDDAVPARCRELAG